MALGTDPEDKGFTYRLESRSAASTRHRRVLRPDGTTYAEVESPRRATTRALGFESVTGQPLFTLAPTRGVAPRRWRLADPGARELATFTLSYTSRGRTRINLADGRSLEFRPDDGIIRDHLRSMMLADTDRWLLTHEDRVIATTGNDTDPSPRGRAVTTALVKAVARLPGEILRAARGADGYRHAGQLTFADEPDPALEAVAAALLVFRHEVIGFVRSP